MKKLILLPLLLLNFIMPAFSQKWKALKLDTLVSVALPDQSELKDTLGQQIYQSRGAYGTMLIIRSANSEDEKVNIKKEKDLGKLYESYIKKVQNSSPGNVTEQKDTTIAGLNAKDFTLQTDTGSGVELRYFRVLFTQDATYTFEYLLNESRKEFAREEQDKFFNSIKIGPEVNIKDSQLADKDATTPLNEERKSFNTYIYLGIGLVVIVVLILIFLRRKKRQE
jgi:hypothetical protein